MLGRINYGCLILVVTGTILLPATRPAYAQSPAVAYYPAAPAVAYVPEARGLFGLRTVYRPVAAYPYAPMMTYYAPPTATTMYYPSANVTSYYAPAAPFFASPPPVSVRYAPRPMIPYTVIGP